MRAAEAFQLLTRTSSNQQRDDKESDMGALGMNLCNGSRVQKAAPWYLPPDRGLHISLVLKSEGTFEPTVGTNKIQV